MNAPRITAPNALWVRCDLAVWQCIPKYHSAFFGGLWESVESNGFISVIGRFLHFRLS